MGRVSAEMLYDLSCIPANSAKGINNRAAFPEKIQNIALLQKKIATQNKSLLPSLLFNNTVGWERGT